MKSISQKLTLSKYFQSVEIDSNKYLISHGMLGHRAVVDRDVVEFLLCFKSGMSEEKAVSKFGDQVLPVIQKFKHQLYLVSDENKSENEAILQVVADLRLDRNNKTKQRSIQDQFNSRELKTYSKLSLTDLAQKVKHHLNVGILMDCMLERTANLMVQVALKQGIGIQTFFLDTTAALENFPKLDVVILRNANASSMKVIRDFYYTQTPSAKEDLKMAYLNSTQKLIQDIEKNLKTPMLVHTLALPSFSPMGVFGECLRENGLFEFMRGLNQELIQLCKKYDSCFVFDEDHFLGNLGRHLTLDDGVMVTSHVGPIEMRLSDQKESVELTSYQTQVEVPKLFFLEEALANHYIDFLKILKGIKQKKMIVVDLDNTLWPGLVGEDNFDINRLDPIGFGAQFVALHQALKYLKSRGILLAVVSKNNEKDVLEKWKVTNPELVPYLLTLDDFVTTRINWEPKDKNIQSIVEEVDIGIDSVVFVDDHPVELERVRTMLPLVTVIPANFHTREKLLNMAELQTLEVTSEAFKRSEMVKGQLKREKLKSHIKSPEEFLRDLNLTYEMKREVTKEMFGRVHELILRTNQFNTTTRRYSQEELKDMLSNAHNTIGCISIADKFTHYGLVGVILTIGNKIDSMIMSCRVLGLGVEDLLLRSTLQHLQSKYGYVEFMGELIQTPKNTPCQSVFLKNGFTKTTDSLWMLKSNEVSREHPLPGHFKRI